MAKALQTSKIQGPKGEKLVVALMSDGRVRIKISQKVAVSAIFPGTNTSPEAIIIIQPI